MTIDDTFAFKVNDDKEKENFKRRFPLTIFGTRNNEQKLSGLMFNFHSLKHTLIAFFIVYIIHRPILLCKHLKYISDELLCELRI